MKIIIVTGMSGSGKTVALKMFEDFGYYCVDNLPVELVSNFVELTIDSERGMKGVALGIDIRSGLDGLDGVIDELKHKKINMEILFLEADDETLIKRYKETRRNHPLAADGRLIDGIHLERQRLAFLRAKADRIMDTGRMLTKELKQELRAIYVDGKSFNNLFVTVLSFGYMYGIPDDPDLLFDVRFLPNPFYDPDLRLKTGEEHGVADYVFSNGDAEVFLDKLDDMIRFLIPRYIDEGKSALVIGIGCTGGQHRSVAIAAALKRRLDTIEGIGVRLEHRDMGKNITRIAGR
ncbi:RNase adapter RapZ [Lachnoanaerobaculum orale]|uniref:RNase adapter RapZ n=1 Tax=Lachnoanaerobaculum orale TaxID=979627 RepID=UPI0023A80C7E|nr:RNase adapter RapZ [Lachnoanaerobaculum orale]